MRDSKYNKLFRNMIPNSIEGIKIFSSSDKYIKPQKYNDVTNFENKIWSDLYQDLEFLLDQYASKEYLIGLRTLPIPNNMFPENLQPITFTAFFVISAPRNNIIAKIIALASHNLKVSEAIKEPKITDKFSSKLNAAQIAITHANNENNSDKNPLKKP